MLFLRLQSRIRLLTQYSTVLSAHPLRVNSLCLEIVEKITSVSEQNFNYLNFIFRLQQLNDVAMTLLLSAHVNSRGLTWTR